MSKDKNVTPEVEENLPEEQETPEETPQVEEEQKETPEPEVEAQEEEPKVEEKTIAELTNSEPEKEEKPDTVPLASFLDLKKANKELAKTVNDLKKSLTVSAEDEVSPDVKALAEKYDVDQGFISSLFTAIKADTEAKFEAKLKPLEEKEKAQEIDKIFRENYDKAIKNMPEYKGVAKEGVIKTLSLNPDNANKTFSQIITDTYGHLIKGKPTIESNTAGQNREDPTALDYDRARTDSDYFRKVMSNPLLKKKYNEGLEGRVQL